MILEKLHDAGIRAYVVNGGRNVQLFPTKLVTKDIVELVLSAKQELINELNSINGGPGTELTYLIPKLFAFKDCDCQTYAQKMDRWGVAGCNERFNEIVEYLCNKAKNFAILSILGTINKIVATRWVRQAIANAEIKSSPITVVWPYLAEQAIGEELRYSIRSIENNFIDLQNIVVCGDKPNWYSGNFIESKKTSTIKYSAWFDCVKKIQAAVDSDLVSDTFMWFYDDTFLMRRVKRQDLSAKRIDGVLCKDLNTLGSNNWKEVLRQTAILLKNHDKPQHNYSHHGPFIYEKEKLRELFRTFNFLEQPVVMESFYFNYFHDPSETVEMNNWLSYSYEPTEKWKIDNRSTVINVGKFTQSVENEISKIFTTKSSVELFNISKQNDWRYREQKSSLYNKNSEHYKKYGIHIELDPFSPRTNHGMLWENLPAGDYLIKTKKSTLLVGNKFSQYYTSNYNITMPDGVLISSPDSTLYPDIITVDYNSNNLMFSHGGGIISFDISFNVLPILSGKLELVVIPMG